MEFLIFVSTGLFKSNRTNIKGMELFALIKAVGPKAFRLTQGFSVKTFDHIQ